MSYTNLAIQMFCLGVQFASLIFIIYMLYANSKLENKPKFAYLVYVDNNNRQTIEKVELDSFNYYTVLKDKKGICYFVLTKKEV